MDERAALPVSLPHPSPTVSYWQDPPDAVFADYQSSGHLPQEADVVVIGSGITGAGIAWNLLSGGDGQKRSESIVMLEARQSCSGATGRNGGHTKAASYRSFPDNAKTLGIQEAIKIARFEHSTIRAVHDFAREKGIGCDSWQGDTVDIIYDQAQWEEGLAAIQQMREAMSSDEDLNTVSRYEVYKEEEGRERFHVQGERFAGAVKYEAGSLSAYKFVIGVLGLCLKHPEFALYTHCPATTISRDSGSGIWTICTPQGNINAKRVVLATNGYTAHLLPEIFQGKIVPLRGQVTAQRPGSNMPKEGPGNTYSFIYEGGYEYMIPRPPRSRFEGDIVIGGGLTKAKEEGLGEFGNCDDTNINTEISTYLFDTTARYFGTSWGGDDEAGRIREEWTGIMGYSVDGFPFVGEVKEGDGLWVAASFQGHGMVLCWGVSRAIAAMINAESEGTLDSWFPKAFRVDEKRLEGVFGGRLHTTASAGGDGDGDGECEVGVKAVDVERGDFEIPRS